MSNRIDIILYLCIPYMCTRDGNEKKLKEEEWKYTMQNSLNEIENKLNNFKYAVCVFCILKGLNFCLSMFLCVCACQIKKNKKQQQQYE